MPIRVAHPNGDTIEFPDGTDDATISRVMRQVDQETEARNRAGGGGVGAQIGADVGRMSQRDPRTASDFARTYARLSRERMPQGRPGSIERGLEDFNRSGPAGVMEQMWRNVGVADELAGGFEYLTSGGNSEAARAAMQYERDQQRRVAREQPGVNAASIAASVPAFGGNPVANAPRLGLLQAGGTAAAINAPFALARQEGSLTERLPGAAQEEAAVFGLGAGLQGVANWLGRTPRPNSGSARAQQFEAAGVRPTQAAISGGTPAGVTKLIAENFIAGGPARNRLAASIDDTAEAARRLAGRYGQHGQPENVGEAVQAGINRVARDADVARPAGQAAAATPIREWSFRAKANELYERVFRVIERDEAGHLAGNTGVTASVDATRAALAEMRSRVQAPALREIVNNPRLAQIAEALESDQSALRFNDLRALRTWVREQRAAPSLTQTIDQGSLARLESALTQDIYASAMEIGGEAAAQQLRRVDQFYRAGAQRIQNVLQPFADRTGRGAYDRIVALAREGGRQNSRALQSLRNSLRPDEWREVAATIIDDLGRPTAGNPNALQPGSFSVEQFVTNYAKLSQDGRRILFGGAGREDLAHALDNLAQVAGYQKGVERMVNSSRSGVNAQNFGSFAGLANPGTMLPTAGLLAAMRLTGEMLTNPAFVRWLASAAKVGGGASGMRRHLQGLATLASRDPALAPLYSDLAQSGVDRLRARSEQPQERRELVR